MSNELQVNIYIYVSWHTSWLPATSIYPQLLLYTLANRSAHKEKQTQPYESVKRKDCASFSLSSICYILKYNVI